MAEERIAAGDYVRINPNSNPHPRATEADIGPNTAAFYVSAYDKDTKVCTLTRQGKPFGEYAEADLIKVEAPVDNTIVTPPDPPPPDTMTGGATAAKAPAAPFARKK